MSDVVYLGALACVGYIGVFVLGIKLRSARAQLAKTRGFLEAMTVQYNEAHRDRQLLLAEAGAHRAVELAAKIPGLTDDERRAIGERLEAAKAASPKVRVR